MMKKSTNDLEGKRVRLLATTRVRGHTLEQWHPREGKRVTLRTPSPGRGGNTHKHYPRGGIEHI